MDQTILGLPLAKGLPQADDYTMSPHTAIAVVKGFDSDGDEFYSVVMTEGLSPVDAAGLLRYATIYTDESLKETVVASAQQPQEE